MSTPPSQQTITSCINKLQINALTLLKQFPNGSSLQGTNDRLHAPNVKKVQIQPTLTRMIKTCIFCFSLLMGIDKIHELFDMLRQ